MFEHVPFFECEIPGRVGIKKNAKRLFKRGNKVGMISSDRFRVWEHAAYFHVKQTLRHQGSIYTGECKAQYIFHFKNRAHEIDVSNGIEGPQDLLAKLGIIENDKQIIQVDAQKVFSGRECTIIKLFKSLAGNKQADMAEGDG